jgi:SPX domain protein involved in polyphosphate accumulation
MITRGYSANYSPYNKTAIVESIATRVYANNQEVQLFNENLLREHPYLSLGIKNYGRNYIDFSEKNIIK